MAKFVYGYADGPFVHLEAGEDEEIPVEMAAVWAQLRQASALERLADNIVGLDNGLGDVARAIFEK